MRRRTVLDRKRGCLPWYRQKRLWAFALAGVSVMFLMDFVQFRASDFNRARVPDQMMLLFSVAMALFAVLLIIVLFEKRRADARRQDLDTKWKYLVQGESLEHVLQLLGQPQYYDDVGEERVLYYDCNRDHSSIVVMDLETMTVMSWELPRGAEEPREFRYTGLSGSVSLVESVYALPDPPFDSRPVPRFFGIPISTGVLAMLVVPLFLFVYALALLFGVFDSYWIPRFAIGLLLYLVLAGVIMGLGNVSRRKWRQVLDRRWYSIAYGDSEEKVIQVLGHPVRQARDGDLLVYIYWDGHPRAGWVCLDGIDRTVLGCQAPE